MDAQGVALVDVVKAVEGMESGAVRGCEPGDVRDVVVHLNRRLATMRRAAGSLGVPGVTLQDEYALEVILRSLRTMATGNELWLVERAFKYLDERMMNWRGKRKKGRWNRDDERAVEMVMRLFSVVVTRTLPARPSHVQLLRSGVVGMKMRDNILDEDGIEDTNILGCDVTDQGMREMGYHTCPNCEAWFMPRVPKQIYCVRCELSGPDHRNLHGHRNPRAELILSGYESYKDST